MKRYGLNLRVQPSQNNQARRPPLPPPPFGFRNDDDDDDDDGIEREISRQAMKNKSLKDIEEQHKKALAVDPSAFDYDGVYDEMKEKAVRPQIQDRQEKRPKYIQTLIDKAKEREREHEIIYERKLAKERSKDEHLFADKDKFVTGAYKRKLAEQAKWLQEDRLRQLREDKEDVTKKSDISEFYFNLSKNVAFGAEDSKARKAKEAKLTDGGGSSEVPTIKSPQDSLAVKEIHQGEGETSSKDLEFKHEKAVVDTTPRQDSTVSNGTQERSAAEQPPLADDQPKTGHHKRNDDAVAAAKERFLARKRAKVQEQ